MLLALPKPVYGEAQVRIHISAVVGGLLKSQYRILRAMYTLFLGIRASSDTADVWSLSKAIEERPYAVFLDNADVFDVEKVRASDKKQWGERVKALFDYLRSGKAGLQKPHVEDAVVLTNILCSLLVHRAVLAGGWSGASDSLVSTLMQSSRELYAKLHAPNQLPGVLMLYPEIPEFINRVLFTLRCLDFIRPLDYRGLHRLTTPQSFKLSVRRRRGLKAAVRVPYCCSQFPREWSQWSLILSCESSSISHRRRGKRETGPRKILLMLWLCRS